MHETFAAKGIRHEYREYTSNERKLGHVFNVTDPEWPEVVAANREMLAWFQSRRALREREKWKVIAAATDEYLFLLHTDPRSSARSERKIKQTARGIHAMQDTPRGHLFRVHRKSVP